MASRPPRPPIPPSYGASPPRLHRFDEDTETGWTADPDPWGSLSAPTDTPSQAATVPARVRGVRAPPPLRAPAPLPPAPGYVPPGYVEIPRPRPLEAADLVQTADGPVRLRPLRSWWARLFGGGGDLARFVEALEAQGVEGDRLDVCVRAYACRPPRRGP